MKLKVTGNSDDIELYKLLLYNIYNDMYNPYWSRNLTNNDLVKRFKQYHYELEALSNKSEYLLKQLEEGKKSFWQNKDFFCFLNEDEQKIEIERLNSKDSEEYEPYYQKLHIIEEQYSSKHRVSIEKLSEIQNFLNTKSHCDGEKNIYKVIREKSSFIEKSVLHDTYIFIEDDIACCGETITYE